jgi:site-specific recombinase
MNLIDRLRSLRRNWQAADVARLQLDELLACADPTAAPVQKNEWLIELGYWLRKPTRIAAPPVAPAAAPIEDVAPTGLLESEPRTSEALTRLRYLLRVLERNPECLARVAATVQSVLAELDAISLLCDTGVPQSPGLWGELRERLAARLIPATPQTGEWSELLSLLFPDASAANWIESIDAESWRQAQVLFVLPVGSATVNTYAHASTDTDAGTPEEYPVHVHGMADVAASMRVLVNQACAAGLTSSIRSRMGLGEFAQSPFLPLARAAEELLGDGASPDMGCAATLQRVNVFRGYLEAARVAARHVFLHLDENGVSVDIEFRVEGILARIERIEMLLEFWLQPDAPAAGQRVLGSLVRSHEQSRSLGVLWRQSFARLARKVVDRSAETGLHYITRTRAEYRAMLKAALGGGVITVVTVYVKFVVTSAHFHRFFEGLLASLNYAGSFLVILFAGFTLATKQPAMTAPALAAKLDDIGKDGGMEAFVEETLSLMRSQAAAVFGNVLAVAPLAFLVQWAAHRFLAINLITIEKAHSTIDSFSLLGPTPLYAAATGVLLWISSLVAGWADNWFVYRRIGNVIAYQRRLRFLLGDARALRWAAHCREHFSGVIGNVALGFLLGLAPIIAESVAVPFEVRHVTLSSGALAAAVGVLGPATLSSPGFWLAVAGIVAMAILNVGVSFFFAFQLALRSRDLPRLARAGIYRAIARAILTRPASLLFVPPRTSGALSGAG